MLVVRGHHRWWGIGLASAIMPMVTAITSLGLLLIAINLSPTRRSLQTISITTTPSKARGSFIGRFTSRIAARAGAAPPDTEPRFLLWPVADPNSTFPSWFECAQPHLVATYTGFSEAVGIERWLPFVFVPYLHGYPTTRLYQLPPGCPAEPRSPRQPS